MPENTPGSRDTNPNPVAEQLPHSGVNGYERPVYNFNGTNLQEALDRGDLHIEYDEQGKPRVIVPDTIGEHLDPTKSQPTESHVPLVTPEKSEKKSKLLKVGGAVGAAIIAGGTILGISAMGDDAPKKETTSATPTTGSEAPEPSPSSTAGESEPPANQPDKSIIENLDTPSTPEQIEYVIAHPVSLEEYPDPVDALVVLGQYDNVLFQADPDKVGAEQADAMFRNIYDSASPYFEATRTAMNERREIVAAQYGLHGKDLRASVSFQPTVEVASSSPEGAVVNANIIYSGNVMDFMGGNPDTAIDFNADFVLSNDGNNWHIYAGNNAHKVGDIG